jgi:chemotaxis protein MotB
MNHDQPIIIIKKKPQPHAHHGGAWKVAYADFVTAMMAFFLVMWILGLNQDTRKSIAAYFNDPTGMMKSRAGGASVISINRDGAGKKKAITNGKGALLKFKKDREGLEKAKSDIEKKIVDSAKFKAFKNHIDITLSRDGLRIELLEDRKALFFESGSANLRQYTVELLRAIGPVLARLPNNIVVEGHTDARPYAGGNAGYSNWNLSADRANEALKALQPKLRSEQVTQVTGFASTRLRNPDDPNHFSNRRISVLVQSSGFSDDMPVREVGEEGLIGLKPTPPNLEVEFLNHVRGAVKPEPQ